MNTNTERDELARINTTDELYALPEGAEIVDCYERLTLKEDVNGFLEWHDNYDNICHVTLPATIVYTPEPAR